MYFLEHFLNNSSMDDVDQAPIPQESLARRLGTYYGFLLGEQNKVPSGYETFYVANVEGINSEQLALLLNRACVQGKTLKRPDQEADRLNYRKQIECILVRLNREGNSKAVILELFGGINIVKRDSAELYRKDRIFLAETLQRQRWSREAIVDLFYETYLQHYGHPVDPR